MKARSLIRPAVAAATIAAALLAGACESGQTSQRASTSRPWLQSGSLFTRQADANRQAPAPAQRVEEAPPKPVELYTEAETPRQAPRQTRTGRGCDPIVGPDQTVATQAFPTGEIASSALVVHTVMPRQVRVGQSYEYQLQVCNLTNGELQNVVVTSENTQNLEISGSNPPASRGADGNPQWVLGSLGPNEMEIITVTGRAGQTGVSSVCVAATYNNFLCAETQVVEPALALRKRATNEAILCEPIELAYVVTNSGTGDCENVVVRDRLPDGLTTAEGQSMVTFNAGTLAAGQSKEFTVQARASRTGRFSSAPQVTSDCGAEATAEPTTTIVRQPNLNIEAVCKDLIYLGRNLTFTFNVSNTGDAASANTVVTAPMPSGTTFVSADNGGQVSGNSVVWNLGTLPAEGGNRSVSMVVKPAEFGTFRAGATAEGVCAAQVSDACETEVKGIPAILLEVVDSNDPIEIGEQVTYVITVTNQGSAPGTGIQIVCEVPEQQTFVSAGGATAGTLSGSTITFAPLPNLPPRARAEFRVTVQAAAAGSVRFLTTLTSDQFERPVQETEATNLYE